MSCSGERMAAAGSKRASRYEIYAVSLPKIFPLGGIIQNPSTQGVNHLPTFAWYVGKTPVDRICAKR